MSTTLDFRAALAHSPCKAPGKLKVLHGFLVQDSYGPLYSLSDLKSVRKRPAGPIRLAYAQALRRRWDRMQKFYRDRNRQVWAAMTLAEKRQAIADVDYRSNIYDGAQEQLVHQCQLDMKNLYSADEVRQIQEETVAKHGNVVHLVDTGQVVPILWSHGGRGFYFETIKAAKKFGRHMLGPDVEFIESTDLP